MPTIQIPHEWLPRRHQRAVWRHMERGGKRACIVWHRRAGKDSTCLNWTAAAMFDTPGVYWHLLPEQEQARKAVWNGMDRNGRRFIDQAFPVELRTKTVESEMRIHLRTAVPGSESIWQLCGSDNYNSLMGANPRGVVFSEYSLSNPAAWNYIRPILAENDGWAMFNMTPRGMNHGFDLYEMARQTPGWFAQLLTIEETGIISEKMVADERAAGMPEEMVEQEFYCSFSAANIGSYYGKLLTKAEREGRIGEFPWVPGKLVHTAWDIGRTDDTSIWFFQLIGRRVRIIDFHSSSGGDVPFYADLLAKKPYKYAAPALSLPHDGRAETLASPRSVQKQFKEAGYTSRIVEARDVQEGIQEGRATIEQAEFNAGPCKDGLNALKLYQRHWNEERRAFEDRPVHDWTSHPADAFRVLARVWRTEMEPRAAKEPEFQFHAGVRAPTWNDTIKMVKQRRQV